MSQSRPATGPQRLLPAAVEHSVNDLAIRVCGGALVAFAVSSWLALLSWQQRDQAFPAALENSKNLLGSFGAGLSDMMVQTIGIACVFALVCPLVWGMELLANVRWINRFRLKFMAFVASLLALAGMASGLPPIPGWPLLGGAGGMLGDLVFNFCASTLQHSGFDRTGWLPAAVLAIGGLALLKAALGLRIRHLLARLPSKPIAPVDTAVVAAQAAAHEATAHSAAAKPPQPPVANPDAEPASASPAQRSARAADFIAPADEAPDTSDALDESCGSARAFAERFAPGVATTNNGAKMRLVPAIKATIARKHAAPAWHKPSLNLLRRRSETTAGTRIDITHGASQLVDVLSAFGVKGEIKEGRTGPVVTRYELEPARGTKIARVISLADDFARELGVHAVRVSVTPGRTTIGIEVPNENRESVVLRDVLESEAFTANPATLPLALGKGIGGESVVLDLARMPHLLVAGTTGSGKSVGLNAMLLSLVYRLDPSELRLLLIDPKMLEMAQYDRIPHLLHPVITDPLQASQALEWAVGEMEERYKRMALAGARNIEGYNSRASTAAAKGQPLTRTVQTGFDQRTGRAIYEQQPLESAPLPYIVIVIDELADLMLSSGKRIDASLQRLAQKARAAGIHLVMATQRPSVDVVTGTIKSNFPVRISFRVASKIDSRTILNEAGAEQLLGHGDMLLTSGSGQHLRVHGAYVADEEIERVTQALREQGEPNYVELIPPPAVAEAGKGRNGGKVVSSADAREGARRDEVFAAAVAAVIADRKASPGHLHRRLGIPEDEANAIIDQMERDGIIGPPNMFGRRPILIKAAPLPAKRAA